MPDLLKEGIQQLHLSVWAFNKSLQKTEVIGGDLGSYGKDQTAGANADYPIELELDVGANEEVNELFSSAREG